METMPHDPAFPVTVAGLRVRDAGCPCGVSVSGACTLTPFQLAVVLTRVFALTLLVGTPKEADELPAATVTEAGGNAAGLSLVMLITAPLAGA